MACGVDVDDGFEMCWNCGANPDGTPDPTFVRDDVVPTDDGAPPERALDCLRCGTRMTTFGRKRFHAGTRMLPLIYGQLGELMVERESFDIYACPSCGKLEFFAVQPTIRTVSDRDE
jgi:hypothetical protein